MRLGRRLEYTIMGASPTPRVARHEEFRMLVVVLGGVYEKACFYCSVARRGLLWTVLAGVGAFAGQASAQMLVGPNQVSPGSKFLLSGSLARSDVNYNYDTTPDDDAETERTMLALGIDYQLQQRLRLLAQAAFSVDSEINDEGSEYDGNGYGLGVGGNYLFKQIDKVSIFGHAFLNLAWDKMEDDGVDLDQDITDFHLGASAAIAITREFQVYGGLDLALYSEGEAEFKSDNGSNKVDIERDGMLNLMAGVVFEAEGLYFRPHVTLGGEQTLGVAVHKAM